MSPRGERRGVATALVALGLTLLAVLAGRAALRQMPDADEAGRVAGRTASAPAASARRGGDEGPGAGIVIGRIIDRETGLAVRDAGVTVQELGRRSISLPDGRFRFDGLQPGRYTLIIGPAESYVPRSLDLKVLPAGTDLGIIGMVAALPPVPITAADGGSLSGCGEGHLRLAPAAIPEDIDLSFTCLERQEDLPVGAPAGRLPLAALHLSPENLGLITAGELKVSLPLQPRYAAGVSLDLFRLDLDRALWRPAGILVVAADGRAASGEILALGDYLVAAPPFGAFAMGTGSEGASPGLLRLNTSVAADGAPAERVDPGTAVVYLDVSLAGLPEGLLTVRTVDAEGRVRFEGEAAHAGSGNIRVPMTTEAGGWDEGEYLSTVAFGEPAQIQSLPWRVAAAPAQAPPAAWVGASAALPADAPSGLPPAPSFAVGCSRPAGWWAYLVQPGDSLSALAVRTGTSVAALQAANCLQRDSLFAGQTLYVPTIVYKQKPPLPAWGGSPLRATPLPRPPDQDPGGPWRPAQPTALPYVKATRPPDPTLAPRPTDPPAAGWAPPLPQAPPPVPDLRQQPAVAPTALPPVQGSGSWKEPRGPEPTLAPRPSLP